MSIGPAKARHVVCLSLAVRPFLICLLVLWAATTSQVSTSALATYRLGPGWATFGLALPKGAAADGVRVGELPTQTDVKVRWADGSIRFAVVSAHVDESNAYPISAATQTKATFTPAWPDVAVTLVIGGKAHVAKLPAALSDWWLQGPLVAEGRAVIAPGGHPFLRVIFDVRSYSHGGQRVDITVENCLDATSADQVTYDVTIDVAGESVFNRSAISHKYLARWRQTFTTAGLQESAITPDFAPFVAAAALPEYLPTVVSPSRSIARLDILGFGDFTVPMNAHGGRPEIAPYPDWTAQYLVHKRPDQRAYMLKHGELGGSWGIHIRQADGSLPTIDKYPYYWLDARWKDNAFQGPLNVRKDVRGNYVIPGQAEPGDIAHQPSLAYVPYLVTGDRFFAEEMAFWANYCLIGSFASDHNRKGSQGLLIGNEVRGIGWALRNIGDAAAYLPDRDPLKSHLAAKLAVNLRYLENYAATFQSGPVKSIFPWRRPEDEMPRYAPYTWISLWEQSYVAWAIDRVLQHGQLTAAVSPGASGATLRNRIARLQLSLFVSPDWPKDEGTRAPYLLATGTLTNGARSPVKYFQNLREVAAATFAPANPGGPPDFLRSFAGYYGPEARLLLLICDRLGDPGAADALASLMSDAEDGGAMRDDVNKRSGWAIAPAPARGVH